mmetsp:Transcript_5394/g.5933  ORF Transcript_5394/g.5933 Transcript_5394/m.5933 type:complete len:227 (+) Transcript_5394:180-860(+)
MKSLTFPMLVMMMVCLQNPSQGRRHKTFSSAMLTSTKSKQFPNGYFQSLIDPPKTLDNANDSALTQYLPLTWSRLYFHLDPSGIHSVVSAKFGNDCISFDLIEDGYRVRRMTAGKTRDKLPNCKCNLLRHFDFCKTIHYAPGQPQLLSDAIRFVHNYKGINGDYDDVKNNCMHFAFAAWKFFALSQYPFADNFWTELETYIYDNSADHFGVVNPKKYNPTFFTWSS